MKRRSVSILSGKGFYVALALSVSMVGAACYFAYTQTADDPEDMSDLINGAAEVSESSDGEMEAANIVTGVTKAVQAHTTVYATTAAATQTSALQTEECAAPQKAEASNEEKDEAKSEYAMPIDGEVLNEFSGGELVRSETTGAWQTHNGVDIKASAGESVKAVADGTVSSVENDPLWGVSVTIDHGNGMVSKYCSLDPAVSVQAGQKVSCSEEIGTVGDTADIESSMQTHLHFEVIKNGSYIDPKELF